MTIITTKPNPFNKHGCGSKRKELSWIKSITDAMGDSFREGVRILDWGCGAGRLANWISKEVQDFEYLGIDIRTPFGEQSIEAARSWLGRDPRVEFSYVDEFDFDNGIEWDVVVLASVLTHIEPAQGLTLLGDLITIAPKIVFTCFGPDSLSKASSTILDGMIKRVIVDDGFFDLCRGIGSLRELSGFDAYKNTRDAIRHRWFELSR